MDAVKLFHVPRASSVTYSRRHGLGVLAYVLSAVDFPNPGGATSSRTATSAWRLSQSMTC
jgi:hypothetical protein